MGDFEGGSIIFTSPRRVPKGAVPLTKEQALQHQWKLIHKWNPRSDVLPLTAGPGVNGVAAGVGGAVFVGLFRRHYRLANYGRASVYLPCVLLPAVGALLSQGLVSSKVVLMDTRCTACLQLQADALQAFFGFVYPALMVPAACASLAVRCGTYALPPLRTHFRLVASDALRALRVRGPLLSAVFGLQCATGFLVLHFQMNAVVKIGAELGKMQ